MSDNDHNDHNGADEELRRRIDRRIAVLDEIAEHQETLKQYKAEDKSDGYVEKALGVVIKAKREDDAEKYANQLGFEAIVDTYRQAVGLTVDLDMAYTAARAATAALPANEGDA